VLLGLAIHNWYGTAIEALNALSYAVLAIPQIIFGVIMYRKAKGLRAGSVLMAVSGVLSVIALVGVGLQNGSLAMISSFAGGGMYMVSLAIIGVFFVRQPEAEAGTRR
jgi:hypothetical protein